MRHNYRSNRRNLWRSLRGTEWSNWADHRLEAPPPTKNSRSTKRIERELAKARLNLPMAGVPPLVAGLYARLK